MKKSFVFFLVLVLSASVPAQVRRNLIVPSKVKDAFIKLFPDYNDVKWEASGKSFFGSFVQNGRVVGAFFKADTLFADIKEVYKWEMPAAVIDHLIKTYPNYTVLGVGLLHFRTKPEKNSFCFSIDIKKENISKRIICYPNGTEIADQNILGDK